MNYNKSQQGGHSAIRMAMLVLACSGSGKTAVNYPKNETVN